MQKIKVVSYISDWIIKILIPCILTVSLFVVLIFGYMIPKIRELILKEKKEALMHSIQIGYSLVVQYYDLAQKNQYSTLEAQKRVLARIKNLHFGYKNKDYIWIHDIHGTMLMHPYVNFEGENLMDLKDIKGKKFIADMVNLTKKQGDGFVDYYWQWQDEPKRIIPKLSYVKLFEPWGWILGSGIYTDDVNREIAVITKKMVLTCSIIIFLILIISVPVILHSFIIETKRRKAETDLADSEKKFRHIVEKCPFPMLQIGFDRKIEYVNPKFTEIIGYELDEIKDLDTWFEKAYPDINYRQTVLSVWETDSAVIDAESCFSREFDVVCKNKEVKTIVFRLVTFNREKNFVFFEDITDRRKAQKRLAYQAKKLKRSNIELEQYALIASHDMQEPLRIISTYLHILEKEYGHLLNERGKNFVTRSIYYSNRMRFLIKDLLTFSRIKVNIFKKEPVDLSKTIEEVLKKIDPMIRESGARIECANMPVIMASPVYMDQLFTILICNSIKFKSEKIPHISIGVAENNIFWLFSIKDNGIGIDAKYAKRIFGIFERLNPSTDYNSTGIGLAAAKKIVDSYGGKIWVESEPDKGSVFKFSIPK